MSRRRRLRARRKRRRSEGVDYARWLRNVGCRFRTIVHVSLALQKTYAMLEALTPVELFEVHAQHTVLSLCDVLCCWMLQNPPRSHSQTGRSIRKSFTVCPNHCAHATCIRKRKRNVLQRMNASCDNNTGNTAGTPLASPPSLSADISACADDIISLGPAHESAQQARDAAAATFGGDILCDPEPFISSADHGTRGYDIEAAPFDCQYGHLTVAQVQAACVRELITRNPHYASADIFVWGKISLSEISTFAHAFALDACAGRSGACKTLASEDRANPCDYHGILKQEPACLPSLPVRGMHRCDAMTVPPCAECLSKRSCTRGVPIKQRSFLASRGGGVEGSEDFRNNPHLSLRLPAGGTHAVNIEVSDVPTLLRHCSKKKNVQPAQNLGKQSGSDLEEEFAFIPPLLLASLLSHYQDALSLQCLVGVLSLCTILQIDFCKFVASRNLRSTKAFKELWLEDI